MLALALIVNQAAGAFEPIKYDRVEIAPKFTTRIGLQHGEGINYGLGAFDTIGHLFVTGPTGTNVNDFRAILIGNLPE